MSSPGKPIFTGFLLDKICRSAFIISLFTKVKLLVVDHFDLKLILQENH